MDFYRIRERTTKRDSVEVYPDFKVIKSKDLMIRGNSPYAVWDEATGMWSTDEYDIPRLVDADLQAHADDLRKRSDSVVNARYMSEYDSKSWVDFCSYISRMPDSYIPLDGMLTFSNTKTTKQDYASKRLPYPLAQMSYDAWEEIASTLYEPVEREKIEWAIGAIIAGDAKSIQKFMVLYGSGGSGKSTVLRIIDKLFKGYKVTFEAKALTSNNNQFSTAAFKNNALVAINDDADLSRIEDNTKLNSIVSHEEILINEKNKPAYTARVNAFLFMGSNKPVKITDAKSGLIRRLIDVRPSGRHIPTTRYHELMKQVDFELGGIAHHCLEVYKAMGKEYFSDYRPVDMMMKTDVFFNFIEEYMYAFEESDGISLTRAYAMYKEYCTYSLVEFKMPMYRFREELKNYFREYHERVMLNGERHRKYYVGFEMEKFETKKAFEASRPAALILDKKTSNLDELLADCPAQYAGPDDIPRYKWANVTTTLSQLNTSEVHYVRPPENHIVIDFDLTNEIGEKDVQLNLEAAGAWPQTYAEFSKSGNGVHLHYNYDGDPSLLSRLFSPGIEVKVFTGNASLRRRFSSCNGESVRTISSGLALADPKPAMISDQTIKSERGLRDLILRNLNKEIHPGTKPSIDFIKKILDDAYNSDLNYDVTDMRNRIIVFANNSTNQPDTCLKIVQEMKFKSEEPSQSEDGDGDLVVFDVEVFPNFFGLCWKTIGEDNPVVKMKNPSPAEIESLIRFRLVGFNNRQYDNHILYGRLMGYSNEQLYELSQKIINGDNKRTGKFGEAYGLSYADIYDFSSKKQSLKRFQIELGLTHKELGIPWDQPISPEQEDEVMEYCANDVDTTEAVFIDRAADLAAREILAEISGLAVNDSTQQHTAKIIFGEDREPQHAFVYHDLAQEFPGYVYSFGKSSYRGEDPGEGGYVYAEPGIYRDVAVLDVESMHPTTIEILNLFGPYTKNYNELRYARLAIKNKEFEKAKGMLNGALAKHMGTPEQAEALSYALKIVINIVYGLTSAKFKNKFRDERNVDNIVAKRGALFMIDLKHAVQEKGFQVIHIKTDSIKIPDATPEIIKFVQSFGQGYGYTFKHEATYDRMCLVNDAVYIAKVGWSPNEKKIGTWEAVGAQFQQPFVYKTLFSKEPITFNDMCETKSVTTALYLDLNEDLPEGEHNYHFVGKSGQFSPVIPGVGGGELLRIKGDKYYSASGAKGYLWMESIMMSVLGIEDKVDQSYYRRMVDAAINDISKFGDVEAFLP